MNELYAKDANYKTARDLFSLCNLYASAYNDIMLKRIEEERPEILENLKMDRNELIAHLMHNMCLPYGKTLS